MSAAESRREVAERTVRDWKTNYFISALNMREGRLIDAIEAALKERDERAARIAQNFYTGYGSQLPIKIADAIRNEDANAE